MLDRSSPSSSAMCELLPGIAEPNGKFKGLFTPRKSESNAKKANKIFVFAFDRCEWTF